MADENALVLKASAEGSSTRLSPLVRVFCALFFLSGLPALLYQLVWQRALFRILGVNIESVTVVVTAFMLGLGLGSLFGGWLSRRRPAPVLLILAAVELATAVFGVFSLSIFAAVGDRVVGLPLAVVAATTLVLVMLPTLLMGATLPLLVGHLTRRIGEVGESVGLLYYVNTLGASAACVLGVTVLFPFVGMHGSVLAAAAINALVGVGALVAHLVDRRSTGTERDAEARVGPGGRTAPAVPFARVLALSAAGGFVALAFEIFFFRAVSYASAGSAPAFATTLGIFLLGLAVGGREGGEASRAGGTQALVAWLIRSLLIATLVCAALLPLLAHTAWLGRGALGVALVLVFVVARHWGRLLPCLAQLGIATDGRAGMRTAQLYLANILGAASGSVATGFFLMEWLGLVAIGQVLVAAGLLCALAVATAGPRPRLDGAGVALVAASVVAAALIPFGSRGLFEALQHDGEDAPRFAELVQNRSGIVAVDELGVVYGGGAFDGAFNIDPRDPINGLVRPYALSLFHPAPREVLVIGLASGSWTRIIASHPNVERVTVVEINPGYRSLISGRSEVASILDDPKIDFVHDDGRRWLRTHPDRRFDAIITNMTFHFRANATNLLSEEFVGGLRDHLRPGGVVFYNTTDSPRVQRTGCSAFAHGARFTNHVLLSDAPVRWDFERWRSVLERYEIDGRPVFRGVPGGERLVEDWMNLKSHLEGRAVEGAEDLIETCPEVLERTDGLAPVTDDNMGTEWRRVWGLE